VNEEEEDCRNCSE